MCHVCPNMHNSFLVESDLDLFQGDIVLHEQSQHAITKRNARRSRKFLWSDKTVPYAIAQELSKKRFK